MSEHERRVESLRQQNHRLQVRLAEAEARAERWKRMALAGTSLDTAAETWAARAALIRHGDMPEAYIRPYDHEWLREHGDLDAPGDTEGE